MFVKPIWAYDIRLCYVNKSNISIFKRFQSKLLRVITEASWFASNKIIHENLKILCVTEEIVKLAAKSFLILESHTNQFAIRSVT